MISSIGALLGFLSTLMTLTDITWCIRTDNIIEPCERQLI